MVEVVVALVLISMTCISVFGSINLISRLALANAIRGEAFHLLQAEAERLQASDFATAAGVADTTITSTIKTSFRPNTTAKLQDTGSSSPIVFTRRVVDTGSTATMKSLRVEVEWTWKGKQTRITAPVLRYP